MRIPTSFATIVLSVFLAGASVPQALANAQTTTCHATKHRTSTHLSSAARIRRNEKMALRIIRKRPDIIAWLKLFNDNGKSPRTGGIPVIAVDSHKGAIYTVHAYESVPSRGSEDGHTATVNWYDVNVVTGKVSPTFSDR